MPRTRYISRSRVMSGMIDELSPNRERLMCAAFDGYSTATDLADWLVSVPGIPFREAHGIVGRIVRLAEDKNCELNELPLSVMQSVYEGITEEARQMLDPSKSVAGKTSYGGSSPTRG